MDDHEAIAEFISAMKAAGVDPVEPVARRLGQGKLIRFRANGDKAGRQNGWAVLHLDGRPAGAFGCYRLGVSEKWKAGATIGTTPAERRERAAAWKKEAEARQAGVEHGWASAAAQGARLMAEGVPARDDHPYLVRKGIGGEGMSICGGALLVPMCDVSGALWNVQRIRADGTKRFLPGGKTAGLMWRVGKPNAVICIGEGVSTMAAVRRATGHAVVASFSAKNLEPVARLIAAAFPDSDAVICADDDAHLLTHPNIMRNLGMEAAYAAASAIGARVAVPPRSAGNG